MAQPVIQEHAVRQPGQKVVLREMGHPERHRARLAHVAENYHGAGDLTAPVVNGGASILNGGLMPVAADQSAMRAQADGRVMEHRHCKRVQSRVAAITIYEPQYLL